MAADKSIITSETRPSTDLVQILGDTVRSPKLGSMIAMAAAITLGIGLIMSARAPDYIPVYERMDNKDAAQITELLNGGQYDYKVDPGTGVILVPRKSVSEIRIQLSAAGLGSTGEVGLELLQEENSLGTSQFMETARYQHALETELSRTISSLRNIKHARVHLALPKQSVFIRNRAKSSASVMVQPMAGRSVEPGQVSSIVNLVASSIPYLESNQVTVVDQLGRLLSSIDDGSGADLTTAQYTYTRKLENLLSKRIESLFIPLVGEGRVRTSVTADIDFTVNEQTQELFEADPTQIRSEDTRVSESAGAGVAAKGIPGALTNQPNGVAPMATQQPARGDVNNQATRNFELDKTIRHTRQAPSIIRRLSAAIIIDDKSVTNEAGEIERIAVTAEEIERLTVLAKEAIGFDANRGDSVSVLNQSFQPLPTFEPLEPQPIWEKMLENGMVKQVFSGLAVLLLILMVVRPAMKILSASAATPVLMLEGDNDEGKTSESVSNTPTSEAAPTDSLQPPAAVYGDILHVARAMANEDPARVARVVKDWIET